MRQKCAVAFFLSAIMAFTSATRAESLESCDSITDSALRTAISAAHDYVAKTWTKRGPDWIAAYDSAPVARNPFALKTQDSGAAEIHGFVWARDVTCDVAANDAGNLVTITYTAGALRFNEGRSGWTKPLKNAILISLELTLIDTHWTIADKSLDRSVLLPGNVLRQPKTTDLPSQNAWPDKRCKTPKRWEGKVCVASAAESHAP